MAIGNTHAVFITSLDIHDSIVSKFMSPAFHPSWFNLHLHLVFLTWEFGHMSCLKNAIPIPHNNYPPPVKVLVISMRSIWLLSFTLSFIGAKFNSFINILIMFDRVIFYMELPQKFSKGICIQGTVWWNCSEEWGCPITHVYWALLWFFALG